MTPIGTTESGDFALDLDALIGARMCIAASSGGGKSGAVRKILETTHGAIQQIVLDSEDEFHTLRQSFDYVIAGGEGGDVPATLDNAANLARAALDHGFSLIAQINDLGDDAGAFIARFLGALIAAPKEQWRPLLVVIDEAQRFAPIKGSSEAAKPIKDFCQRGRKRGFSAILSTTRVSELDAGVRGLMNNWMLGYVGTALDRGTAAAQLGFAPSSEQAKGFQRLQTRQFWTMGPALSREPVLMRVGDVATTIVKAGQAHVPTPPAPEALRELLAALAVKSDSQIATDIEPGSPEAAEADWAIERAIGQGQLDELQAQLVQVTGDRDRWRRHAEVRMVLIKRARAALQANGDETHEGAFAGDGGEVMPPATSTSEAGRGARSAVGRGVGPIQPGEVKAAANASPKLAPVRAIAVGSPSPAALAIADLLDRINPARVTWTQAATMTGRKASGGNFNAARKWLRESGRIIEGDDLIRSSGDAPAGMTRDEAIALWKDVLTNPAPRMIDALLSGMMAKDAIGDAIGAAPRGGNFNNGIAQLRRNGVTETYGDMIRLADPLPGQAPATQG